MAERLAVVALGGNAIAGRGLSLDLNSQWTSVASAARGIGSMLEEGWSVVVTHGNGPQVGYLAEAMEALPPDSPRQPLYLATAMTQGWIGYMLMQAIEGEMVRRGLEGGVSVIVTRVLVDGSDPEFRSPSKPIGKIYSEEEALALSKSKGWIFRRDPRGGYRRVVPSPRPISVLETRRVKALLESNRVVVAVGGGGVPVVEEGGVLVPVEAVVDKDLASSVLAIEAGADVFAILTDVPGVALDFGGPDERWLDEVLVEDLKRYLDEGHFPPGSMGPKVEAAVLFVERACRPAAIGSLEDAELVVSMKRGTRVLPGKC